MDMSLRADLAVDVSTRSKYAAIAAKKNCAPCKRSLGNIYPPHSGSKKKDTAVAQVQVRCII